MARLIVQYPDIAFEGLAISGQWMQPRVPRGVVESAHVHVHDALYGLCPSCQCSHLNIDVSRASSQRRNEHRGRPFPRYPAEFVEPTNHRPQLSSFQVSVRLLITTMYSADTSPEELSNVPQHLAHSQHFLSPSPPTPVSNGAIDIDAWTVSALQSLSVSPVARGTGTPLAIPIDDAAPPKREARA
ncbi:hypothetical protein E4U55_001511, partial [Claviceps digitariae]